MIRKTPDGLYVISSHMVWRPGVYDSERAARYAFRFNDSDLQSLQQSVNPGGVITFEMLKGLRSGRVGRIASGAGTVDPAVVAAAGDERTGRHRSRLAPVLLPGTRFDSGRMH